MMAMSHLRFLHSGFACAVMDVPTMSACNKPSDVPNGLVITVLNCLVVIMKDLLMIFMYKL